MKKKVKFLQAIASPTWSYAPGAEAMIDAAIADAWSESGIVSILDEEPRAKK